MYFFFKLDNWSRPIFNLDANFKHLTKEERLERDMEHVKNLNRRASDEFNNQRNLDEIIDSTNRLVQ